jgi:hypothetical protein
LSDRHRERGVGFLLCAVLLALPACSPGEGVPETTHPSVPAESVAELAIDPGGAADRRYRLDVRLEGENAARSLRVRVEPRRGWHLATEAPVALSLEAPAGLRFEPASQHGDAAARFDRDGLELTCSVDGGGAPRAVARGGLRFGICEGEDGPCAIVRRELAFTLPAR